MQKAARRDSPNVRSKGAVDVYTSAGRAKTSSKQQATVGAPPPSPTAVAATARVSEAVQVPTVSSQTGKNTAAMSNGPSDRLAAIPAMSINFDAELSESDDEDDDGSEVESFVDPYDDIDAQAAAIIMSDAVAGADLQSVDPETRARLQALQQLLQPGLAKLAAVDGKVLADPEVMRRLRTSMNSAIDKATAGRSRSRPEQAASAPDPGQSDCIRSLAQACTSGDIETVRLLLKQGSSVHETTEDGESLLSLAASAGYYELCQVLIAMNANIEDRGVKGDCTPLMEAASAGYADIVRLLCDNGADINAKSSAGNTALHYGACGGHEEVVAVLIEAGAVVEEHNENGHTPLMEAASAGFVNVAKILLAAGAGINTHSNEFKESALTLACYKGHLEMVKFLLQSGADQEHKTDEMHTALMEASMDGHVEVARLLLDSGAQVNMPTDSFESPLTLAACGGHVELANLLIERGANLEEPNDEGYTPLMEAAREGHEEMCALLLAHGVDINAMTEETQETALTLACCGAFLEVADFLIKAGADMELGSSTPLMEAAQEGHLELVKYLLKAGANVNAQTPTFDNALTYACENGHTEVAEVLLEFGAELEHEAEGGKTALMKAARVGHLCTVQFLISQGADVNKSMTNNEHTVLSVACAGGHQSVVELLLKSGANPSSKLKDGSTTLIEAAKGGHVAVVNLLLDWSGAHQSASSDDLSSPSSTLDLQNASRVPMQGLTNFVPPQDPASNCAGSPLPAPSGTAKKAQQGASSSIPMDPSARLKWCTPRGQSPLKSQDLLKDGCCSVNAGCNQVAPVDAVVPARTPSESQCSQHPKVSMETSSQDVVDIPAVLSENEPRSEVFEGDGAQDAELGTEDSKVEAVDAEEVAKDLRNLSIIGSEGAKKSDEETTAAATGSGDASEATEIPVCVDSLAKVPPQDEPDDASQICSERESENKKSGANKLENEICEAACKDVVVSSGDSSVVVSADASSNPCNARSDTHDTPDHSEAGNDGNNEENNEVSKDGNSDSDEYRTDGDGDDLLLSSDLKTITFKLASLTSDLATLTSSGDLETMFGSLTKEIINCRLTGAKANTVLESVLSLTESGERVGEGRENTEGGSTEVKEGGAGLALSLNENLKGFISSIVESAEKLGVMGDELSRGGSVSIGDNNELVAKRLVISEELLRIKKMLECEKIELMMNNAVLLNQARQTLNPSTTNSSSPPALPQTDEDTDVKSNEDFTQTLTEETLATAGKSRPEVTEELVNENEVPADTNKTSGDNVRDGERNAVSDETREGCIGEAVLDTNVACTDRVEHAVSKVNKQLKRSKEDEEEDEEEEEVMALIDRNSSALSLISAELAELCAGRVAGRLAGDGGVEGEGVYGEDELSQALLQRDCIQQYQLYLQHQQQLLQQQQLEKMMQLDATLQWRAAAHDAAAAGAGQQQQCCWQIDDVANHQMFEQQQQQLLQLKQQQEEQLLAVIKQQQQLLDAGGVKGDLKFDVHLQQQQQLAKLSKAASARPFNATTSPPSAATSPHKERVFARPTRKLQPQQQPQLQPQQQMQQLQLLKKQQLIEQQQAAQAQIDHQLKVDVPARPAKGSASSSAAAAAGAGKNPVWQKHGGQPSAGSRVHQPQAKQAKATAHGNQNQANRSASSALASKQASFAAANHGVALPTVAGVVQPQDICQHCCADCGGSGLLDIQQQLKLKQQQSSKSWQLGEPYAQQQELLQQAQQLQYQLQQAQQLHNIMQQQKQANGSGTAAMTIQQQQQQQLLAQQFQQQLLQAQHLHQCSQKELCSRGGGAAGIQSAGGTVPFSATACASGTQPRGAVQQQKGAAPGAQQSIKGIVPRPFHFTPELHGGVGAQQVVVGHTVPGYDESGGSKAGTFLGTMTPSSMSSGGPVSPCPSLASPPQIPPLYPAAAVAIEVDAQTEANHDTALTLACAGGHAELVSLLLSRGANIEHRDKKGFTPLILAATGGHKEVVEILLQHNADIEAQSERTKDSPLSLACSGGRFEVVELLLARGANKEHRNVSDYTPLSLAASGGYINIIKLLLNHGAEINSRTGSKLGISPLMLAAMNGHTAAVSLLLDMGSDINAQIETNRNTALTLACFQGRHEVVSLLVNRKANVEHRAKTGLTPLMEAASGGYVEVGKVLLDKGADIAAPPVPSSRDTALTIAADKGHVRFVELLINRGAAIDVKNKKGNSPLWLACNGGHLEVVQLLVNAGADVDSQDNRKVSCLMVAFRKGHVKLIKWLVRHVVQFPSDQDCMRYITTVTDKEILKKCHQCMDLIVSAKERQAAEANKNASILLEELDLERSREELKRAAAARKREKKKQKKKDKQGGKDEAGGGKGDDDDDDSSDERTEMPATKSGQDMKQNEDAKDGTQMDKNISIKITSGSKEIRQVDEDDKKTMEGKMPKSSKPIQDIVVNGVTEETMDDSVKANDKTESNNGARKRGGALRRGRKSSRTTAQDSLAASAQKEEKLAPQTSAVVLDVPVSNQRSLNTATVSSSKGTNVAPLSKTTVAKDSPELSTKIMPLIQPGVLSSVAPNFASSTGIGDLDDFGTMLPNVRIPPLMAENLRNGVTVPSDRNEEKAARASRSSGLVNDATKSSTRGSSRIAGTTQAHGGIVASGSGAAKKSSSTAAGTGAGSAGVSRAKKEDAGWKEVSSTNKLCKKIPVPSKAISRIIGRAGCNINAIRDASGAHIDLDKLKDSLDAIITIRGSAESMRVASDLLAALIRENDKDIDQILPSIKVTVGNSKVSNGSVAVQQIIVTSSIMMPVTTTVNAWKNSMATKLALSLRTSSADGSASSTSSPHTTIKSLMSSVISTFSATIQGPRAESRSIYAVSNMSAPIDYSASDATGGAAEKADGAARVQPIHGFPIGAWTPMSSSSASSHTAAASGRRGNNSAASAGRVSRQSEASLREANATTGMMTRDQNKATATLQRANSMQQNKSEPVPLPIVVTTITGSVGQVSSGSNYCSTTTNQSSSAAPVIGGDYSPFNNLFSPIAESVMLKRSGGAGTAMNFASVAAAGVIPSASQSGHTASINQRTTQSRDTVPSSVEDSAALQAKAPGYRAPNTASPRVDISSQHGGEMYYRQHAYTAGALASQGLQGGAVRDLSRMYDVEENRDFNGDAGIRCVYEGTPNRTQGGRTGVDEAGERYNLNGSGNTSEELSLHDGLSQFGNSNQIQYSSPKNPMTLPHIDSNLNPNAPNFTSKAVDGSEDAEEGEGGHTDTKSSSMMYPAQMAPMSYMVPNQAITTMQGFSMVAAPGGLVPRPHVLATAAGVLPPRQLFTDVSMIGGVRLSYGAIGMSGYLPATVAAQHVGRTEEVLVGEEYGGILVDQSRVMPPDASVSLVPESTEKIYVQGGGTGGLTCLTQPAANGDTPSSSNPASPSPSSSGDPASRAIRPIGVERLIKKPRVIAGRVQEPVGYNNYMANVSDVDMLHQQQDAWAYGSAAPMDYTTVGGGGDWVMPSMVPQTMSIPPPPIGPRGDEFGAPPPPQMLGHMPQPALQQHPSLTSHLGYMSLAQMTVHPSAAMFDQHPLSYDASMMTRSSMMHAPPLLTNGGGMAGNMGGMSMPPPPHGPPPHFPPPINTSRSLPGQHQFDNMSWGVAQMKGMPPPPPPGNANMWNIWNTGPSNY